MNTVSIKVKIPKKDTKVDPFSTIEPWLEWRDPDKGVDPTYIANRPLDSIVISQPVTFQQMTLSVKFKRLHPDARIPTYAKSGDSGCDLYLPEEEVSTQWPGQVLKIPLGFAMEMPEGWEAQIRPRSSSSANGLHIALGTIDSGYRGEIALLVSDQHRCFTLRKGDRVAQMVFAPVYQATFTEVSELSPSEREGGFGSTGK